MSAGIIHQFVEIRDEDGEREISVRIGDHELGRIQFIKECWLWRQTRHTTWWMGSEQLREIADRIEALSREPGEQS